MTFQTLYEKYFAFESKTRGKITSVFGLLGKITFVNVEMCHLVWEWVNKLQSKKELWDSNETDAWKIVEMKAVIWELNPILSWEDFDSKTQKLNYMEEQ